MAIKEKGCPTEGSPIPNYVLPDKSELNTPKLQLQITRLTRCAVNPGMADTLAPLVFGERAA
jgi:hypothetical protein